MLVGYRDADGLDLFGPAEVFAEAIRQLKSPVYEIVMSTVGGGAMSTDPCSPLRPDQPGNAFKMEFAPEPGERVIQKRVHSCFIGTPLEEELRAAGHRTLVIVGLTTNHCISTSARMAANLGFDTWVVSDATATFDRVGPDGIRYPAELVHAIALSDLQGEFATVVDTESVLSFVESPLPYSTVRR